MNASYYHCCCYHRPETVPSVPCSQPQLPTALRDSVFCRVRPGNLKGSSLRTVQPSMFPLSVPSGSTCNEAEPPSSLTSALRTQTVFMFPTPLPSSPTLPFPRSRIFLEGVADRMTCQVPTCNTFPELASLFPPTGNPQPAVLQATCTLGTCSQTLFPAGKATVASPGLSPRRPLSDLLSTSRRPNDLEQVTSRLDPSA